MITRLKGELVAVTSGRAELACGRVVYELLIPAVDSQRLATMINETIVFHTLHYLEAQGQGTSFVPRLIGFSSAEARAFFELFTTVKGLGNRKALRALQVPIGDIAAAIAGKDTDLLVSLPEIGKRTAESIVAELSGKVDRFVEVKLASTPQDSQTQSLARDAVAVLVQLGETRSIAQQLVDRVLSADPTIDSADALVAAAFRLKELV